MTPEVMCSSGNRLRLASRPLSSRPLTPSPRPRRAVSVGKLLRVVARTPRLTQLDLALAADVSTRHISYVETGRSKPTSAMILHLSEQLEVPLRERNVLLLAGGYAPAYPEHG